LLRRPGRVEARDRVSKADGQVQALLDPQLREAFEHLAKPEGVTPSEYLEHLIRKELLTGMKGIPGAGKGVKKLAVTQAVRPRPG
jgi:hypothetical protein